jgi:flagellar biosynthesis anti-sigma factor FlgM
MRIDLTTPGLQSHEAVQSSRSAPRGAPPAEHQGESQDVAQLSLNRARIAALQKAASADSDIRAERVEALRRVIAEGRYQVDSDQVAEAMLAELLARTSPVR